MADTPYDFGPVVRLEADSQGPPGQRTFRLLVANREETASLWLEKEELQALGMAIDQLIARVSRHPMWRFYGEAVEPYQPAHELPPRPLVEFKVGQLSVGYDGDRETFAILIHEAETDPEGPPTFVCHATAVQMRTLSRRITSVVSAGRPKCPLCGDPVDPDGHPCIRSN